RRRMLRRELGRLRPERRGASRLIELVAVHAGHLGARFDRARRSRMLRDEVLEHLDGAERLLQIRRREERAAPQRLGPRLFGPETRREGDVCLLRALRVALEEEATGTRERT